MPKGKKGPRWYAVAVGRQTGVFTTWDDASAQVNGFAGALHKSFPDAAEASAWLAGHAPASGHRAAATHSPEAKPTADLADFSAFAHKPADAAGPAAPASPRARSARPDLPPTLDAQQRRFVELVLQGENVLLQGVAGTGKSFALELALRELRARQIEYAATAPTGVAAISVSGQTLHSLAGCGVPVCARDMEKMWSRAPKAAWRRLHTLVLDEVSMLSAELLDWIDHSVRALRGSDAPFGGLQLVLCGDMLQLPPVPERRVSLDAGDPPHGAQRVHGNVPIGVAELGGLAFESACFREASFACVELKRVFRQADEQLVRCLEAVRQGEVAPGGEADTLFSRTLARPLGESADGVKPTVLHATNARVDELNAAELLRLGGPRHRFVAVDSVEPAGSAPEWVRDALRRDDFFSKPGLCRVPPELELAVGAQVMLVKNLDVGDGVPPAARLVNGSRGVVRAFVEPPEEEEGARAAGGASPARKRPRADAAAPAREPRGPLCPQVVFANGRTKTIVPERFEKDVYLRGKCVRVQLPLKLAWALTVHKAQGATLDRVKVDLRGVFAEGQGYVALSRGRTLEGMEVANFSASTITANPRAKAFCAAFSDAAAMETDAGRDALRRFLRSEHVRLWLDPLIAPSTARRAAWRGFFEVHEAPRRWFARYARAGPA